MNCCDEYGNCNQGRDCPIRKERVRQAKELLDKDTTTNAQPAPVQEPLGYLEIDDIESQREYPHNCRNVNLWHEGGQGMAAIYTTPPAAQQKPLTTERLEAMAEAHVTNCYFDTLAFAQAIEAAHGITKGQP